jgi:hypothetical protein
VDMGFLAGDDLTHEPPASVAADPLPVAEDELGMHARRSVDFPVPAGRPGSVRASAPNYTNDPIETVQGGQPIQAAPPWRFRHHTKTSTPVRCSGSVPGSSAATDASFAVAAAVGPSVPRARRLNSPRSPTGPCGRSAAS